MADNAKSLGFYDEVRSFYEEKPADSFLYIISKEEDDGKLSKKSFEHIRDVAKEKPCVIIGRCANFIFRDEDEHVSVFVHANIEERIKRIARTNDISEKKAKVLIRETDKRRTEFHNQYTGENWGDSRGYQLSIDSGMIGIEQTVSLICDFITSKMQWRQS